MIKQKKNSKKPVYKEYLDVSGASVMLWTISWLLIICGRVTGDAFFFLGAGFAMMGALDEFVKTKKKTKIIGYVKR